MFTKVVARGRISHRVFDDFKSFLSSLSPESYRVGNTKVLESDFARYMGASYCTVFPYARTGIYFTLKNLDLPAGTKILMPPITIKGILDIVLNLGLEPVFCDIDPLTACFSIDSLNDKLKLKPKVALITYLFGVVPNVELLVSTLKSAGVFVIEDFSQNLNSKFQNQKLGTFGDVGVFSASSVKTLDAYCGGYVLTNDLEIQTKLQNSQKTLKKPTRNQLLKKILTDLARNIATTRWIFALLTFPSFLLLNLLNDQRFYKFVGERSLTPITTIPESYMENYTNLQTNFSIGQIPQIDAKDHKRISIHNRISSHIPTELQLQTAPYSEANYWQHVIYIDEVDKFRNFMFKNRIDVGTTSLVLLSKLAAYGYNSDTPNAEYLHGHGVYLPNFYQMSTKQVDRVCRALDTWFSNSPDKP